MLHTFAIQLKNMFCSVLIFNALMKNISNLIKLQIFIKSAFLEMIFFDIICVKLKKQKIKHNISKIPKIKNE
jgi:hypothetical protein